MSEAAYELLTRQNEQIAALKRELKKVGAERDTYRQAYQRSSAARSVLVR